MASSKPTLPLPPAKSPVPPQHKIIVSPASQWRRRRRQWVTSIAFLLLVGLIAVGNRYYASFDRWWNARQIQQVVSTVADGPDDNQLRNRAGAVQGAIRYEQQDLITKVIFSMNNEPPTGQAYHGWLFDPTTFEYRYAGAFYEISAGSFGLVYSTEENIDRFSEAVISLESHPQPGAPTQVILGGSRSTVTEESTPTPQPSPEPAQEQPTLDATP